VLNLSGTASDMLAEARRYHLSLHLARQPWPRCRDTQLAPSRTRCTGWAAPPSEGVPAE
jgi:hypothetical protein